MSCQRGLAGLYTSDADPNKTDAREDISVPFQPMPTHICADDRAFTGQALHMGMM